MSDEKTGKDIDAQAILAAVGQLAENPNPFDTGDAGRAPKLLACASLPYKNPKPEQLKNGAWVRENGDYSLVVQGGMQGIPFGMYPRLFLFWLTEEVHRTGNRIISTGSSYRDFCRQLNIDTSVGKRGPGASMMEQIERLLDARISYVARHGTKTAMRSDARHMNVADERQLFWDTSRPDQETLFESTITLTEQFFKELTEHYIPIDMRVVNTLRERRSPLELDVLLWLSLRLYAIKSVTTIKWDQLYVQLGSSHARLRDFRNNAFIPALRAVLSIYTTAKVHIDDFGVTLYPSPPLIPRKFHQVPPGLTLDGGKKGTK